MNSAVAELTQTPTTKSSQPGATADFVDSVQITKGSQNTIFELWHSCPDADEYNGHYEGKTGYFIKVIEGEAYSESPTYTDKERSHVQPNIVIDEEIGMQILEEIRQTNEKFVTA